MDSSTRRPRRIAASAVVNVTAPQKRRLSITKIVNHRPVGAASMERWSRPPRRIAASAVVSVTVPERKRSRIASHAGSASTAKLCKLLKPSPRLKVFHVTVPNRKPLHIASRVGAACKDEREENSFKLPRPTARPGAVSVTIHPKRHAVTIVYRGSAGSALTAKLCS
jgi:hypothetical protein